MIHELVRESFPVEAGFIEIPDRPGLGITPDPVFLERHAVRGVD
jgi:L-alanine-DL-glutamate epimerase-like enolase superfamily enzyme